MRLDIRDMFDDFYEEEIDIKEKEGFSSDNVFSSTVNKIKENEMNKSKRKILSIPILAFSIIMMVSVSVFAAYKFLTPKDVANLFNDTKLSKSFTKNYTLSIKEQTSGNYTAKILGIASGKKLSSYTDANEDKSYIVGAIARNDGTKILNDYIDACEVVKETEAEIRKLEKKKKIVQDKVTGSNPEWPYEPRSFSLGGTIETVEDANRLNFEKHIIEMQREDAEALKLQVEEWMKTIPFRMQRIIRYKYFNKLSWEDVATLMKSKRGGEAIRLELYRFMKKK